MSETEQKAPPPLHFVDRSDPAERAEGLMRVVNSLLTDPAVPEEVRRDLENNEVVQRLRSALAQS